MTLPALATAADIDRYLPPAPELQQTSRMSLLLAIGGTDRRTDVAYERRRRLPLLLEADNVNESFNLRN